MKSILYIAYLVFAIIAIGTLSYNYISTEPTTNVITKSSDTNNTGIKVNGEWELTVYNKDGSIEETHEFTNDLDPEGPDLLIALLTGDYDANPITNPITWEILLPMYKTDLKCRDMTSEYSEGNLNIPVYATVTRDLDSFTISKACTVDYDWFNFNPPGLQEDEIDSVITYWCYSYCDTPGDEIGGIYEFDPEDGGTSKTTGGFLTSKKFYGDEKIKVIEGQAIAVNVKISFQ